MLNLEDPNLFRTVLETLQTGVYLLGRDATIRFWNAGAERITGYRRHEVIGRSCRDNILLHCNERQCLSCGSACPLTGTVHEGKPRDALLVFQHKSGHRVPVQLHSIPIRDRQGAIIGLAESFDEQISLSEPEAQQHNLAAHGCLDPVTGAMNPSLTRSYLREHVAFFMEYDLPFGLLLIRICQLQHFLSAHGREAADDILHVVAETLRHTLGNAAFLGRWTADQFLAIVPNCEPAELSRIGDSIQKIVASSEIRWWGDLLPVEVSVGQTMVQAGDRLERLLERAEHSLDPPAVRV